MSKWILKAAVQGFFSFLPNSQGWNEFVKRRLLKRCLDRERFEYKLGQCREHLRNYFERATSGKDSFAAFELGTGFHPVIPICLYLCGAQKVWTADASRLLDSKRVLETSELMVRYAESGVLGGWLPMARQDRVDGLKNLRASGESLSAQALLEMLNIHYLVCDARYTGLKRLSVDLFVSNNTLEHVPLEIIPGIFSEFRRIAAQGAVMSHFIDICDHYAYADRSITPYNYLKYPSRTWRFFNNSLHYQNRLRVSDYRKMHRDAGFNIIREDDEKDPPEVLGGMRVAEEFSHYPPEDLLTRNSWMVSAIASERN
jgi:hypothetical protein